MEWGNNMNIPQMQQRWTGYSSEGSGSLLGAVLGARQMKLAEAENKRTQGDYDRRVKFGEEMGAYMKDAEKVYSKQEDFTRRANQASAYNAPSQGYNFLQWFTDALPWTESKESRGQREAGAENLPPMPNRGDYFSQYNPSMLNILNTLYPTNQQMIMKTRGY